MMERGLMCGFFTLGLWYNLDTVKPFETVIIMIMIKFNYRAFFRKSKILFKVKENRTTLYRSANFIEIR